MKAATVTDVVAIAASFCDGKGVMAVLCGAKCTFNLSEKILSKNYLKMFDLCNSCVIMIYIVWVLG